MTKRLLLTAALSLAASSLEAQSTVKFMPGPPSPSVTAYGYYVGPFSGTITSDPTRPVIDLFCVDVLNSISWGQVWTANFTNLASGDLSRTRQGNARLAEYQKAAYLASLFNSSGVTINQWGGIQSAMWDLLNPGAGGAALTNSAETAWLGVANTWFANGGASTFDFSRWTIVTDVNAAGVKSGRGAQEFLTQAGVTPEPETWVLMGTGLVLIVGFATRRGFLA